MRKTALSLRNDFSHILRVLYFYFVFMRYRLGIPMLPVLQCNHCLTFIR